MMAKDLIEKLFLYGAIAYTIKLAENYNTGIAWMYTAALLIGYAVMSPERTQKVLAFFNQVTKSGV